jgi:S-adenosylmethionine:tRNA ribosyltransferase-isomerase
MNLARYDYELPQELIAQEPVSERDRSRLMAVDGDGGITHREFSDLPSFLRDGDLLIVNDTKVFPARLIGEKAGTGGTVELFLLRRNADDSWDALVKPARRVRPGTRIIVRNELTAEITEKGEHGRVRAVLSAERPVEEVIEEVGRTPLPPYIHREPDRADRERYQTVYARYPGSVAAPTAGFHFTDDLLDEVEKKGVERAAVTLHVGLGTFRPLNEEDAERTTLHEEYCHVPADTMSKIVACRKRGGRVIAVGTTTTRALESAATSGTIEPFEGWTTLFIKPPYRFRAVDMLVTNFHLPRSSLLVMVSTFAGRDTVLAAYNEAVRERYRFYSYGDAMLIEGGCE